VNGTSQAGAGAYSDTLTDEEQKLIELIENAENGVF